MMTAVDPEIDDAGGHEQASGVHGRTIFFDGDIARILIYDRALSDAELNQTGLSLASTYGVETEFVPEPSAIAIWSILGMLGVGAHLWRRYRKVDS